MTRVWLDRNAGFCSGVRRAIRGAVEAAGAGDRPVVVYGELVHNTEVLRDLSARGVATREDLSSLRGRELVVIRSHGVPPAEMEELSRRGLACLDLTCPRVRRVQTLAAAAAAADAADATHATGATAAAGADGALETAVVVVGDPHHPEVRGLLGHAGPGSAALADAAQAEAYQGPGRLVALAQTTITPELFDEVTGVLERRGFALRRLNTLCPFVRRRQAWIERFAPLAGASLILGGRSSSNTGKLYEIARRYGPAYWIASPDEADLPRLLAHPGLALTAGASTPPQSIAKLVKRLRQAGAVLTRT